MMASVECIGEGKASASYEFGITNNRRAPVAACSCWTRKIRIFIARQKRGVFRANQAGVAPLHDRAHHPTPEGHKSPRSRYLKRPPGDAANVILSAVGRNFRRILASSKNSCPCSWLHSSQPSAAHRPNRFLSRRLGFGAECEYGSKL
jgi:hypothetical protein